MPGGRNYRQWYAARKNLQSKGKWKRAGGDVDPEDQGRPEKAPDTGSEKTPVEGEASTSGLAAGPGEGGEGSRSAPEPASAEGEC